MFAETNKSPKLLARSRATSDDEVIVVFETKYHVDDEYFPRAGRRPQAGTSSSSPSVTRGCRLPGCDRPVHQSIAQDKASGQK
jgi:hypothetical protein